MCVCVCGGGGLPPGPLISPPPAPCPKMHSNRQMRLQNAPIARLAEEDHRGVGKGLGIRPFLGNPRGGTHLRGDFLYDKAPTTYARQGMYSD